MGRACSRSTGILKEQRTVTKPHGYEDEVEVEAWPKPGSFRVDVLLG